MRPFGDRQATLEDRPADGSPEGRSSTRSPAKMAGAGRSGRHARDRSGRRRTPGGSPPSTIVGDRARRRPPLPARVQAAGRPGHAGPVVSRDAGREGVGRPLPREGRDDWYSFTQLEPIFARRVFPRSEKRSAQSARADSTYLVGDRFTVADACLFVVTRWRATSRADAVARFEQGPFVRGPDSPFPLLRGRAIAGRRRDDAVICSHEEAGARPICHAAGLNGSAPGAGGSRILGT